MTKRIKFFKISSLRMSSWIQSVIEKLSHKTSIKSQQRTFRPMDSIQRYQLVGLWKVLSCISKKKQLINSTRSCQIFPSLDHMSSWISWPWILLAFPRRLTKSWPIKDGLWNPELSLETKTSTIKDTLARHQTQFLVSVSIKSDHSKLIFI